MINNIVSVPCTGIARCGQSIQLTLPYNVAYNVSMNFSLCGQMSISDLQLQYGEIIQFVSKYSTNTRAVIRNSQCHVVKCGSLLHQLADDSITIAGYSDPSLVGSTITIGCRFGSVSAEFDDTTNITCMENGEWNPDPQQIKCKGIK